jgi:hypothetical protein
LPDKLSKKQEAFLRGLSELSFAIREQLGRNDIYIGLSVINEILYSAVVDQDTADPIEKVFASIVRAGVHKPGILVFPLVSIGFSGFGLFQHNTKASLDVPVLDAGLVLTPQTNSLDETRRFLDRACKHLGIPKKIDADILEHYHRSRPTKWLRANPLIALSVRSFMGSYYANQYAFLIKLKLAITVILMASVLQPDAEKENLDYAFSSSRVNNRSTRDINHYLVFENFGRRKKLYGNCIPMNLDADEFAELSSFRAELRPALWKKNASLIAEIADAVRKVERKYVWHAGREFEGGAQARVCRKLFDSMAYFRRSFLGRADPGAHVIDLAIAFEVLLTDSFASGVGARLVRRFKLAVSDAELADSLSEQLVFLYNARSEVVHKGRLETQFDVTAVRKAYIHAFVGVVKRLDTIPRTSGAPIKEMLGDVREQDDATLDPDAANIVE